MRYFILGGLLIVVISLQAAIILKDQFNKKTPIKGCPSTKTSTEMEDPEHMPDCHTYTSEEKKKCILCENTVYCIKEENPYAHIKCVYLIRISNSSKNGVYWKGIYSESGISGIWSPSGVPFTGPTPSKLCDEWARIKVDIN